MDRLKLMVAVFVVMALICAAPVLADSGEDKISTTFELKQDWFFPESGDSFDTQTISIYMHYKWIGGGIDIRLDRHHEAYAVAPYVTANKGPWYVLVGIDTSTTGQDFLQTGLWYINSFGKLCLCVDIRNYWALNNESSGYLDNFVQLTYKFGRFYAGAEADYSYWWEGSTHSWLMVGPVVGYELTKNITAFARFTHEWDFLDSSTSETNRLRVGLRFCF